MQFYYGKKMPLRILDEAEFWKRQEKEHTVVIRKAIIYLENEYVNMLEQWEQLLSKTHQKIISFIESVIHSKDVHEELYKQIYQLISYCFEQSMEFIEFLQQVRANSVAVKNDPIAKTLLDHIIRESEYFIGIARVFLYGDVKKE